MSGHAGRFDIITLTLNIGSLIGILGLATFICDIVALYVHRQSGVYRQQKFQDVDLNLLRLETLNSLAEGMMGEVAKRKHEAHLQKAILTGEIIENNNSISLNNSPHKEKFRRTKPNHYIDNNKSSTSPLSDNYHQQQIDVKNSLIETPPSLLIKQRRSTTTRPSSVSHSSNLTNEKIDLNDKVNIVYTDDDGSLDVNEINQTSNTKTKPSIINRNEQSNQPSLKLETFL